MMLKKALALCFVLSLSSLPPADSAPLPFEPSAVRPETWTFNIVDGGEVSGATRVTFGKTADAVWIHDVSELGTDVAEDLLMRFSPDLAPVATILSGNFGATYVNAQFHLGDERLRGRLVRFRAADGAYAEVPVDAEWSSSTVLRGALIWLAHSLPLSADAKFSARWFAPLAARFEQVSLRVTGEQTVTVPAGTFETYRLELSGGTPENVLFVTTTEPRRTVRIDVGGRDMTIELVSAEPSRKPEPDSGGR